MYSSTILITGATSGLGLETALSLAKSHPQTHIVVTGRTRPVDGYDGHANITYIPLDLSTHETTRSFIAEYLLRSFPPICALVLNAGHQVVPGPQFTKDGIEAMFAVNHVNHALLVFLLAKHLASNARIISVASSTHDPKFGRVTGLEYLSAEKTAREPNRNSGQNDWMQRYALSKLANVLFTYALHDYARTKGKGWIVTALDPGVMPTKLYREQNALVRSLAGWFFSSRIGTYFIHDLYPTQVTAATLSDMATDERFGAANQSGKYFAVKGNGEEVQSSEDSYSKDAQKDLWDWTVKEVLRPEEASAWAF